MRADSSGVKSSSGEDGGFEGAVFDGVVLFCSTGAERRAGPVRRELHVLDGVGVGSGALRCGAGVTGELASAPV